MPSKPRYFTYFSIAFFPLLSIRCLYSRNWYYTSLRNDVIGGVVIGGVVAAAVMVPSVTGAVICGIAFIFLTIATGLHVKNSTLLSYREMKEKEMKENKVEPVNPITQTL